MSFFLPLQSLELAMSAICFSLFVAQYQAKDGQRCAYVASASCFGMLLLQHFLLKDIVPMVAVSLVLTIATGMIVVFALKLSRSVSLLLSIAFGVVFALSAYEIFFYVMDMTLMLSIGAYIGLAGMIGAHILGRISHPSFKIACRVGASWIVAASILMSAFFI